MASIKFLSSESCHSLRNGHVNVPIHEHNTSNRLSQGLVQESEQSIESCSNDSVVHRPDDGPCSTTSCQNSGYIDGDPLRDDDILMEGPRITDNPDGDHDAIMKVPSDQALSKFRWGSRQRISGRSKSGLQILVPGRKILVEQMTGGPVTGKSIIYAYASSTSSSGKSTCSFGAVGDHLPSARSALLSSSAMPVIHESQSIRTEKRLQDARRSKPLSPLADLVRDSIPDGDPYQLLVVGETGPYRRQVLPQIIVPSSLKPLRRRSLSDLIEPPTTISDQTDHSIPHLVMRPNAEAPEMRYPDAIGQSQLETTIGLLGIAKATYDAGPPIWHRAGPPLKLRVNKPSNGLAHPSSQHPDLDPAIFSMPYGSKVFIMKSTNIYNLRASVTNGVWSSTNGANRVLQSAWDDRQGDEKIIFMFSITHSHKHSGKYVGMAEMSGPFDPHADPQIWAPGLKGNKGTIPMRWIVAKDVQFGEFSDLKYKGQCVTQLRHANTVPGEAGRLLVQLYFEAEHSDTAVIHPEDTTPITPPGLVKKPRRLAPQTRPQSRAQVPVQGAYPGQPIFRGAWPTCSQSYGPMATSRFWQQPRYSSGYGMAPRPYGQVYGSFSDYRYPHGARGFWY